MCPAQTYRRPSATPMAFAAGDHAPFGDFHDYEAAAFPRSRQSSTCSERSCEAMSADETRSLWRVMLALQERYACYNSTRVSLALQAGDAAEALMPSRFIIDTLNDSLVDLPEEAWEMLDSSYVRNEAAPPKQKRRFWTRRS
jgi:hypothetical protein